jgi:hypothetical protein
VIPRRLNTAAAYSWRLLVIAGAVALTTVVQGSPPAEPEAPARKPERKPQPLPRPGLAGGTAEARGLDNPEKPDLA